MRMGRLMLKINDIGIYCRKAAIDITKSSIRLWVRQRFVRGLQADK